MEIKDKRDVKKEEYIAKYTKEHYDSVLLKFQKKDNIAPLLNLAVERKGCSKISYVKEALLEQFKRDGITIELLTELGIPLYRSKKKERVLEKRDVYIVTSTYLNTGEEDYVAVFATVAMAKKYIYRKFLAKPYPTQWYFTIYGRRIESIDKKEAMKRYRQEVEFAKLCFENWMPMETILAPLNLGDDNDDVDFEEYEIDWDAFDRDEFEKLDKEWEQSKKVWEEWKKNKKSFVDVLDERLGEPFYVEVVMHDDV